MILRLNKAILDVCGWVLNSKQSNPKALDKMQLDYYMKLVEKLLDQEQRSESQRVWLKTYETVLQMIHKHKADFSQHSFNIKLLAVCKQLQEQKPKFVDVKNELIKSLDVLISKYREDGEDKATLSAKRDSLTSLTIESDQNKINSVVTNVANYLAEKNLLLKKKKLVPK